MGRLENLLEEATLTLTYSAEGIALLDASEGEAVTFDQVLTVVKDDEVVVGKPLVEGAKVTAKVEAQGRDKKILVFKYKAKSNYRRRQGHRQPFTKVVIDKIEA